MQSLQQETCCSVELLCNCKPGLIASEQPEPSAPFMAISGLAKPTLRSHDMAPKGLGALWSDNLPMMSVILYELGSGDAQTV